MLQEKAQESDQLQGKLVNLEEKQVKMAEDQKQETMANEVRLKNEIADMLTQKLQQ